MPIYVRVVAILMVVVAVRLLAAPGRVGAVKPIGLGALFYLAQAGAQLPFLAGIVVLGGGLDAPVATAFMIALLFSVFEESSRYLGFVGTATMRRNRDWSSAVLYGAGHGGTQALRFLFLGAALPALAATSSFRGPSGLLALAVTIHRLPAIVLHAGLAVFVMYGIVAANRRFFLLAVAVHGLVDFAWLVLFAQGWLLGADLLLTFSSGAAILAALRLRDRWPIEVEVRQELPTLQGNGIRIRDLTKVYDSEDGNAPVCAIDNLSLNLEPGHVLALLGHNGAGKTTTLRILGGLLAPTSGAISVAGINVRREPERVRRIVGLQSEEPGLYRHMRIAAYLDFFARLYDVPKEERKARIERLLERLQLTDKRDAAAGTLSKGNKQKVALARTLVHNPRVLLLDEPTSALDPAVSKLVRELMDELGREGRTIVLATHNLHEAQSIADDVAIVHKGRLIRFGAVHQLDDRGPGRKFVLGVAAPHGPIESVLSRIASIARVAEIRLVSDGNGPEGACVSFSTPEPEKTNPELLAALLDMGLKPYSLTEAQPTLEEIYLGIDRELGSLTTQPIQNDRDEAER